MSHFLRISAILMLSFSFAGTPAFGQESSDKEQAASRKALYLKTSAMTGVPWTLIAACDQHARNVDGGKENKGRRHRANDKNSLISLTFDQAVWSGPLNPDKDDDCPKTIDFFGGIGKDGNGDNKASRSDPEDRLYTFADKLASFGPDRKNQQIGLWNLYRRGKTVELITMYADLFAAFNRTDLSGHAFPLPLGANYDYRSTWGARRGWGGLRIHEGTDLFADYGTPVRATSYGIVEMIGWNRYGGWRLGIRDIGGNYHYYAHLRGYAKGLRRGQTVEPGQEVGYVGSSGYGPEGTQGKFPPHLHYGIYRDNGRFEYSFDPYPLLSAWETDEKKKRKK